MMTAREMLAASHTKMTAEEIAANALYITPRRLMNRQQRRAAARRTA